IMKKALIERLTELVRFDQHELLEKRYKRFRQY
ncbi:MAG: acetyl-CoA carboxylase carboxyl transferase subunit alpha, partial [Enterococcus sp.]